MPNFGSHLNVSLIKNNINILLTGANGFIGKATAGLLSSSGYEVLGAVRQSSRSGEIAVGEISGSTEWSSALAGCDVVLHLAARAHVMKDAAIDPLAVYRSVNTEGTLNLARQAAKAGVRRFVFVSSIKVNGERTAVGSVFNSGDVPCPEDPYGISKHEAEVGLHEIANKTGMEVVIIRPPLVYGPRVKGNFATMLRWLKRGIPLPFGAVAENRRSFVALDNLVDLLVTCIEHPAATNQTFLVSDGEDLSTTELLHRLGVAMGKPAHLLPVPPSWLQAAAKLLGKSDMAERLLGNLQVDISHTCKTLGWKPSIGVNEGLRRAVQGLINDSLI